MSDRTIPIYAPLEDVKEEIKEGDLLLFRGWKFIAVAGRSVYSHAAKAACWDGDLFCIEVREFHGGRAITLERIVRKYPGRIDVFEVNPENRWREYDRQGASRFMRELAGSSYGWRNVIRAGLSHLPFVRWFLRPNRDDEYGNKRPPFCSQAVAAADRLGGGVDPVPHLADCWTEPSDLARSPFYRYRFTLK